MKKHKMLITLAGLVVAVATTATVAAYTLAGDGSSPPAGESAGTHEPAFQDDKPTIHGDPTYETWLKDNPPTDDMSDTPPLHDDPEPREPVDGNAVPDIAPDIEPLERSEGILPQDIDPAVYAEVVELAMLDLQHRLGLEDISSIELVQIVKMEWADTSLGNPQPGVLYGQVIVPGFKMVLEAGGAFYRYHTSLNEAVALIAPDVLVSDDEYGEVVPVLAPEEDVEVLDDQIVRVGPGTGELIDPLLATGAQVEVTGEVVSEGIFSVDGTIILVNGERVQVMDFGDAAALEAQAAGISPTGSSIATNGQASMVLWVAPPHFFRTDTAIVLYVGENLDVIDVLTSVLGHQFAGR